MGLFEDPAFVDFYSEHRHTPDDLYPSERYFLPDLARQASSVLDVGCATGGFADIWRFYNPAVQYTGVDVSGALIQVARVNHPEADFLTGDCAVGLPLEDGTADVVSALGFLHWEPRYVSALCELWRLTTRYLFFDVRLLEARELHGTQILPGGQSTPYMCFSWPRFSELLIGLQPGSIRGYGYFGPPAESVIGVPHEVCFATFVLERGEGLNVSLDMPLVWPHKS